MLLGAVLEAAARQHSSCDPIWASACGKQRRASRLSIVAASVGHSKAVGWPIYASATS
jgi:hypothetical protein